MSKAEIAVPDSDRAGAAPLPRETLGWFGHPGAEAELLNAYKRGRLPHAWIIGGPEGVGKATLAWRFARFLLANPDAASAGVQNAVNLALPDSHPVARRVAHGGHGDVFVLRREWDDKNKKLRTEISVDSIRKAITLFRQSASEGGWRICILDSAEDLNKSSANALLKLVEEPPEKSLFLIIAQKPGQILPTIRSRCRKLLLQGLTESEIVSAIGCFAKIIGNPSTPAMREAAGRAQGSVREAMRLLDPDSLTFDKKLRDLLARLPAVDWRGVYGLADAIAGRAGDRAYDAMVHAVLGDLAQRVTDGVARGQTPASLAPLAECWTKLRDNFRDADAYNLDRKALVVGMFAELSAAAERAL